MARRPPDDSARPWEVLAVETVYECRLFSVVRQQGRSPRTGQVHDAFVLDAPDWVNIIPITAADEVVMVRQYRHGVTDITLEVPGGMMDPGDPDPRVAARREMLEETGYDSEAVEPLGFIHPNPALQGNRCHTFVARDVVRRRAPQHGHTEHTEPVLIPLDDIPAMIRSGVISHALVVVAFHRLWLGP